MSKYDDLAEVTLRPGEPMFLLRGQDVLAPYAVQAYAAMLRAAAAGAKFDSRPRYGGEAIALQRQAEECERIAAWMLSWQAANGGKLPD